MPPKEKESKYSLFGVFRPRIGAPADEIAYLMDLFEESLGEFGKMTENNARIRIVGQRWRFRPSIQKKMEDVEKITAANTGMIINMAMSYGGRDEITQGIKKSSKRDQTRKHHRKSHLGKFVLTRYRSDNPNGRRTTAVGFFDLAIGLRRAFFRKKIFAGLYSGRF